MKKINLLVVVLMCTALFVNAQDFPIPIHFYDFEAGEGSTVIDLIGENNGEIEGDEIEFASEGIRANADDKDGCVEFLISDGDSHYGEVCFIRIPYDEVFSSENMSLSMWVKWSDPELIDHGYVIWSGGDIHPTEEQGMIDIFFHKGTGGIYSRAFLEEGNANVGTILEGTNAYDGEWHQIGFVITEGELLSSYYDGEFVGEAEIASGLSQAANDLWLGSRPHQTESLEQDINMMGFIDRFRVWDVALDEDQMLQLFDHEGPEGGKEIIPELVIAPANVNEINMANINVFPNPATDKLHVNSDVAIENIELIDLTGKTLKTYSQADHNTTINTSALKRGIYVLRIKTVKGDVVTRKFVK